MSKRLSIETLEDRYVPAGNIFQQGTVLTIVGDTNKPNVVVVDPAQSNQVRVSLNGQLSLYSGVQSITVVGGNKADDISNNTSVQWSVFVGAGNDTVLGGGVNDTYVLGSGKDVVYDLLGSNVIVTNDDNAKDTVFSNAASLNLVGKQDQLIRFFAAGRTPGAGAVSLEDGVLYIAPSNNGTTTTINQVGNKVILTYNFGDGLGLQTQIFRKQDIDYIAYFGGSGADTYLNNTNISEAAYGSAGNDVIFGGVGAFSLLKGSGGDDILVGRARRNDLSGNGGADILIGLGQQNTFRTDALDSVFSYSRKDLVVAS